MLNLMMSVIQTGAQQVQPRPIPAALVPYILNLTVVIPIQVALPGVP